MPAGFFMGTGLSWNAPRYWDVQVRIGYHGRSRSQAQSFAALTPPLAPSEPIVPLIVPPVQTFAALEPA